MYPRTTTATTTTTTATTASAAASATGAADSTTKCTTATTVIMFYLRVPYQVLYRNTVTTGMNATSADTAGISSKIVRRTSRASLIN